jgi:predicted metallo-beta-lactamase superfamily hydrolase
MDAAAAQGLHQYPPRATSVAHAWLREPIYRELESEALRQRLHPDALTAQIVTAAIVLGLVDELLTKARAELQIS